MERQGSERAARVASCTCAVVSEWSDLADDRLVRAGEVRVRVMSEDLERRQHRRGCMPLLCSACDLNGARMRALLLAMR